MGIDNNEKIVKKVNTRGMSKYSIDILNKSPLIQKLKNDKDRLIINENNNEILGVALEFENFISAKGFNGSSFGKSLLDEFINPTFVFSSTLIGEKGKEYIKDQTKLVEKLNNCMKMINESLDRQDKGSEYAITIYCNPMRKNPEEEITKFKDCVLRFYDIDLDKTNVQIKATIEYC